ncbi:unnamed protein product [Leuciscus chuanchicus]
MRVFFFYLIHRCSVLRQLGCKDGKNWNSKYSCHGHNGDRRLEVNDPVSSSLSGGGFPCACVGTVPPLRLAQEAPKTVVTTFLLLSWACPGAKALTLQSFDSISLSSDPTARDWDRLASKRQRKLFAPFSSNGTGI